MRNAIIFTFFTGLVYSLTIATLDLNGWFSSPLLHFQRERLLAYFLFFLLGSLCYKLKVFDSENKLIIIFSFGTAIVVVRPIRTKTLTFFIN